jgi:nitrous oxidase accessory protein
MWALCPTLANVLVVGPEGQFKTISQAVNAASTADTIRVLPHIYKEDIVLDKQVSLIGEGWPQIHGSGNGSVITVLADGCSIQGLKIQHSGGSLQDEHSGILLKSNQNQIKNNQLEDILFGIYFFHSNGNIVRENTIIGRRGIEVGERGAGLHLWNSENNMIEANIVQYTRDGLYIQNSPGTKIKENRISNLRYGVHFMYSDFNEFEGNTFSDSMAGAAIMYSTNIILNRNLFVRNRGFSSFGILLQDCRNCVTEENLIADNGTGIFLEAVKDGKFRNNIIAENNLALQIFSNSERNQFTGNNFIDNLSPLQIVGRRTSTQWNLSGKGNYWSDYDGYDMNEDGIGDIPQKIQNVFEYMEGNYPRIRLYLSSPAASALAIAERTFPIIQGSEEVDRFPLMKPSHITIPLKHNQKQETTSPLWALLSISFAFAVGVFIWQERQR